MAPSASQVFYKLQQNSPQIFDEITGLLFKVIDNILNNPSNQKLRTLRKYNSLVKEKILNAKGGRESLLLIGFIEQRDVYILPETVSLKNLQEIRSKLVELTEITKSESKNVFKSLLENHSDQNDDDTSLTDSSDSLSSNDLPIASNKLPSNIPLVQLPPLNYIFRNPFLNHIENRFHLALAYKDKKLLERAKKVIPMARIEENAQKRLRNIQKQIKIGNLFDSEISIQEMLLLELLDWFKNDFFTWVDSPECDFCNGQTIFSGMSADPSVLIYTNRVEVYKCSTCQKETYFPRYNDVNILLLTRKGRCGEWANTFTVLCTAMGWDARFIEDQKDHVWTEVYSIAQKRWLHCDACENACDSPLMYETGWKKEISYVFAYSAEEVQDVTWRYTSDHKSVLKKRNKCTEEELIAALIKLRNVRQSNLSKNRVDYLTKRLLFEFAEFMKERKPGDNEKEGRSSGSLQWRLARGETDNTSFKQYVWKISEQDCLSGKVTVKYNCSLDHFVLDIENRNKVVLKGWLNGVFEMNNLFRKEEKDWKMVYLARKEGSSYGKISWKFEVTSENFLFDLIELKFEKKIYENGCVNIQLCSEDTCVNFPEDETLFRSKALSGCKTLILKATLSGGKGDVAWQHSQLFRQEMNCKNYPFQISFTFKSLS